MPTLSRHEDKRRVRGDRTRRHIAKRTAEAASVVGLSGVSLDQIARELRLSKSGVAAAFGTKQELQLATITVASEIFSAHVIAPTADLPAGRRRLRALVDGWLGYVENRVFPGGCFMAAVLPEFDTRPGPVRDALYAARVAWIDLLAHEVSHMQTAGELSDELPARTIAFEIDAVLKAANLARNLSDDTSALAEARAVLEVRLAI